MIVDTSAVVAVLEDEDDAERYRTALAESPRTRVSAATLVEVGVVVDALGDPVPSRRLGEVLLVAAVVVEPLTAEHAALARQAYRDHGRGSGHPARLDLGDCSSCALARSAGEPLLHEGDDFAATDLRSALTP